MFKWFMLTLLFIVAVVGFAGESQARDSGNGEKVVTACHGGGYGGGRYGGGYCGGDRGGWWHRR